MKSLALLVAATAAVACQSNADSKPAATEAPVAAKPAPPAPPPTMTPPPPATIEAAPTRADAPYRNDVQKICDVMTLSGAAEQAQTQSDQQFLVATWLGKNLETTDARKWLVSIKPLKGAAMADALDAEAQRLGLTSCALAGVWRSTPSP